MNKASLVNEAQIIGAQPGSAERSRVELLVIPVPVTDGPAQMSSPIEQAGMSASHEVGGRTQSMDEGDSLDGAPTVGAAFGVNTQYA